MKSRKSWSAIAVLLLLALVCAPETCAAQSEQSTTEFGPVVTAYLKYLDAEQSITDDRLSQREISPAYYRRNLNRIRALRRTAIKLATESSNDYLPEIIAVTRDEFGTLFEIAPALNELQPDTVFNYTFRFIEAVRSGENFYLFARLDPYEQAELRARDKQQGSDADAATPSSNADDAAHANNQNRPKVAPDNNVTTPVVAPTPVPMNTP